MNVTPNYICEFTYPPFITPGGESILFTCEKEEPYYWDANQDEPSTVPGGQ